MGYFAQFKGGSELMNDRQKGSIKEDLLGTEIRIIDADVISTRNGKTGVIVVDGVPGKFYFTNAIFTEALMTMIEDGMLDELYKQSVVFDLTESKNGREYISFDIIEK